jgi:hypothetical protein
MRLVALLMKDLRPKIISVNEKRTKALTVRVTPDDLNRIREAARKLWPGAVLSLSGIILGLARLKADEITGKDVAPETHHSKRK